MINLSQKTKKRDRLFFDKFQYSIEFPVAAAACLRGMNKREFRRQDISRVFEARKKLFAANFRPVGLFRNREISKFGKPYNDRRNIDILHDVYDYLQPLPGIKLMVTGNSVTVYCHDLSMLPALTEFAERADVLLFEQKMTVTTVDLDRPRDTIVRRKSDYSHRLKFRHVRVSTEQMDEIDKFLETYKGHIAPSYALRKFLHKKWWTGAATESHFYIDVNDAQLATMLEIAVPGILDKTYEIIVENAK